MPTKESIKNANKKYYEKLKNSNEFVEKRNERSSIFHLLNKDNEDYKQMKRDAAKRYYDAHKEQVIERVKRNTALKKPYENFLI